MQINHILEGVHDPHIFKAVFMAGSPGAGKSTIAKKLFSHTGLRILDVDKFYQMYKDKNLEIDYEKFFDKAKLQKRNYLKGRLGLLFDGTARRLSVTLNSNKILKKLGYDTAMIFVNTDLETAVHRIRQRQEETGRSIDDESITDYWQMVQSNIGKLQSEFGKNFYIVDNSQEADLSYVGKEMRNFLNTPPSSHIAKQWIDKQTKKP